MLQTQVTIWQAEGWHARPATQFVAAVADSGLQVSIGRPGSELVRGDSVLSLLALGAKQGESLQIQIIFEADQMELATTLMQNLESMFSPANP